MHVRVRTGERRSQAIHPFTIKWVQPISSGTQRGSTYIPGTPRATKSLPPPSKLPALHLCSVHLRHGQLRFLAQSVLLEDWMQGQRTGTSMTFNIVLLQTKGAPTSVTVSPNTLYRYFHFCANISLRLPSNFSIPSRSSTACFLLSFSCQRRRRGRQTAGTVPPQRTEISSARGRSNRR